MTEPAARIRVLVAEDHLIVREGLRALLSAAPDIEVVGEAADGDDAVRVAAELNPDVVVMDLSMPRLNGVDATREIKRRRPRTEIVVLSMHAGDEFVRPAIRAGARGYLLKGSGLSDLVLAIRAVARGETFLSPAIARKADLENAERPSAKSGELSGREREVLQLIAEGHSTAEIANLLRLSVKTVESHRSRLMDKIGVRNVAGLVLHAVKLGLVTPHAE